MKRLTALSLTVLLGAMALTSGCARLASSNSQPRTTDPGMADAVGPSGLSRDSKSYLANDPP